MSRLGPRSWSYLLRCPAGVIHETQSPEFLLRRRCCDVCILRWAVHGLRSRYGVACATSQGRWNCCRQRSENRVLEGERVVFRLSLARAGQYSLNGGL